ncbi:hypothetical protein F5X97DRAFT_341433 [Nemania serpens]|nr:hypothetical protein F5X97DRAFT_341433 [Nemania serpens]
MSSRGRNHNRSRSRTDAFLGALESGQVREAVGALKPSRSSDRHGHGHRHHGSRGHDHYYDEVAVRRSRYDDEYPRDQGYYYESSTVPRRHRSTHSDGHRDDRRAHHGGHHSRGHSRHRRASSSSGPDFRQAAGAAVAAGVAEAWRSRHEPDRAVRVATAAIGAAATDSALGGGNGHKEKRHVVESALAGLVENRVINGPRR